MLKRLSTLAALGAHRLRLDLAAPPIRTSRLHPSVVAFTPPRECRGSKRLRATLPQGQIDVVTDLHRLDRHAHYLKVMRHLSRGFTLVNQHGNNYGGTFELEGEMIPRVIELTWVADRHVQPDVPFRDLNCPNGPGAEITWRRLNM